MNLALVPSRVGTALRRPATAERVAFVAVLIFYTVVQLVNLGRGGEMGQDWITHHRWLLQAETHPWDWAMGNFYQTNPPLYHLLMAPFLVFLRTRFAFEAMGVTNVLVSVAGLILFWKILQTLIGSVWIRFAAVISVTFLPAGVIGSLVIATDAFSQLPVCVLGLCFALYATGKLRWPGALLIATIAVAFALGIKSTAIVLAPSAALGFGIVARTLKQWSPKFFGGLVLFALATGALGLYLNFHHAANFASHFETGAQKGEKPPEPMDLRSALFFRSGDKLLTKGLSGWELYRIEPPSLLISNTLSYPGLLCFGLHSDMLDVLQPHKKNIKWGSFGERTEFSRKISRISVRLGFVTFCASIIAIVAAGVYALRLYLLRADRNSAAVLAILVLAGGWMAAMTIIVLTVSHSYLYQYWHPRLVLPAVVLFAIPVAWISSRLLQGRPRLQMALLAGSVCQAIIHLGVVLGR
jgi:hypothetical protein